MIYVLAGITAHRHRPRAPRALVEVTPPAPHHHAQPARVVNFRVQQPNRVATAALLVTIAPVALAAPRHVQQVKQSLLELPFQLNIYTYMACGHVYKNECSVISMF